MKKSKKSDSHESEREDRLVTYREPDDQKNGLQPRSDGTFEIGTFTVGSVERGEHKQILNA